MKNKFKHDSSEILSKERERTATLLLEQQLKESEDIYQATKIIVHDFSNLLGAMLGNVEICVEEVPESSTARECLDDVLAAIWRARDLVQQILDLGQSSNRILGKRAEESSPDKVGCLPVNLSVHDNVCDAKVLSKSGNEVQANILLVDDDNGILRAYKRMLNSLGHRVTFFLNPMEALELFRHNPAEFDLVISDMMMPGMTGDELVRSMLSIRPDIPIILSTGQNDSMDSKRAASMGVALFMPKPVRKDMLAAAIRSLLGS